jgi:hypothetical protein
MASNAFGLEDRDFWGDPFEREEDDSAEMPPLGLVIAAPSFVPMLERQTLPLLARYTSNAIDLVGATFGQTAIVVAVDVQRNALFAAYATDHGDRIWPTIDPAKMPSPDEMESSRHIVELRDRLEVPWQHAEYLVTVILRGKVSNRARVVVATKPPGTEDPAVREFLESKRAQIGPAPVWPPATTPMVSYERTPASPPLPDAEGIALAVERVVVLREGSRLMLHGSFRLRIDREDIVPPSPTHMEPGVRRPAAIVAIHLVLTGSEDAFPIVLRLRAPSYDPIPASEARPTVTGFFAFDIASVTRLQDFPQTFFLYAFSREVMTGPVMMATVTPDMLPPGAL